MGGKGRVARKKKTQGRCFALESATPLNEAHKEAGNFLIVNAIVAASYN